MKITTKGRLSSPVASEGAFPLVGPEELVPLVALVRGYRPGSYLVPVR